MFLLHCLFAVIIEKGIEAMLSEGPEPEPITTGWAYPSYLENLTTVNPDNIIIVQPWNKWLEYASAKCACVEKLDYGSVSNVWERASKRSEL